MTLSELLKGYLDATSASTIDLDMFPYNVRAGMAMRKGDAIAALPGWRSRYAQQLQVNAFGVLLSGPGTDTFTQIAKEEGDVLAIDTDRLEKRLAARVWPSMGEGGQFGVTQFTVLINELREVAAELELDSMDAPKWSEPAYFKTESELASYLGDLVESSVGTNFVATYVLRQIRDAGLEAKMDQNAVPVLVVGRHSTSLAPKLFLEGRTLSVVTDKNTNKDTVIDTFNKIKKQLKNNKKQ